MKIGSAKAWAKTLGAGLAHAQDALDNVAEYVFAKLKKADSASKKTVPKNPYVRTAKRAVGTVVGFLGYLGDSYYDVYEELKRKR